MSVSTLDPKTALVVIDLQKGIVSQPTAHEAQSVIDNAVRLAKAFNEKQLPVVLVNVAGAAPGRNDAQRNAPKTERPADWAELIAELDNIKADAKVTKTTWGAFASTQIDEFLKNAGVTQIVLCGIATSIGVESTARQAFEAGYHVTLATDAMTDMNADAHENSVSRIFPRLGETGTVDEIIAVLNAA